MKKAILPVFVLLALCTILVIAETTLPIVPPPYAPQSKTEEAARTLRGQTLLYNEISKQAAVLEKLKEFQKLSPQDQVKEIERTEGILNAMILRYRTDYK